MADELKLKASRVLDAAELPSGRSEKFQTVYANTVRIGLTPWDFRFTFGLIVEAEPTKAINEEQVTILMSPQHTKAMLNAMLSTMARWEADNGILPPTPSPSSSPSASPSPSVSPSQSPSASPSPEAPSDDEPTSRSPRRALIVD